MTQTKEELRAVVSVLRRTLDLFDTFDSRPKSHIWNREQILGKSLMEHTETLLTALTAQLEVAEGKAFVMRWEDIEKAPDGKILFVRDDNEVSMTEEDDCFEWIPYDGKNEAAFGITKPTHYATFNGSPEIPTPDAHDIRVVSIPEAVEKQVTTTTPTEQPKEGYNDANNK